MYVVLFRYACSLENLPFLFFYAYLMIIHGTHLKEWLKAKPESVLLFEYET